VLSAAAHPIKHENYNVDDKMSGGEALAAGRNEGGGCIAVGLKDGRSTGHRVNRASAVTSTASTESFGWRACIYI